MIRRVPLKQPNAVLARDRDRGAITRLALLLFCGLGLAGGFVYAGGRHFAALRIGYETQKLRTELEKAREDQRRLILEREAATSPARLERAARQLGMQAMQPGQIDSPNSRIETAATKIVAEQDRGATKVQANPKPNKQSADQKKQR